MTAHNKHVPGALCLLPLCISMALASQAQAQTIELTPTVVTSVAQQSPLTIVTDPKQPRQPVPASDGADYLKTIPGFAVIRNGGSNGDPVLRGMFGSRLNIRTNSGLLLGACGGRMDSPTSYISPESYDRLVVIKGPQSVQWGPGASAGTVLFERDPEAFAEPDYRINGSILVGSHGRIDKLIDAAMGSSQGYLRFVGNHARSDDYKDGNGDRVHSRWKKWNGDLAIGWTPDEDTLLEFTAGRGDGEAAYPTRMMDGTQFKRETLGLRFEKSNLGEVLSKIEAQVYYNYADHVMDNFRMRDWRSAAKMPMESEPDRRTMGTRLAATWSWADVDLIMGLDAMRSEHRLRKGSYNMMTGQLTSASAYPWSKDAVFYNYGTFAELTWHTTERSRWISGARIDRASAKDYRSQGKNSEDNATRNYTRADTLPSGFTRYEYDLESIPMTLYAGLGHTQRFPDYWELVSPNFGPEGTANAFKGIKPEKTTQFDFGLQYQGERLEAWASGYIGQIRDYILFTYNQNMMGMSTTRADNIDARIMGGELGAAYRVNDQWKTDMSLAYAWGKNSSDGRALPQMPPLEARFGLTYEQGDWTAGALWRVVARQGRIAENQGNVVGKDFKESSGFGVFSLNGAYRINQNFTVSLGIDNLFDKAYTEHLNKDGASGFGYAAYEQVNEPGRTVWSKVSFSF